MDTSGWRVLITGGGSGIGLRTAELLVADGARVTALDVDEAGLARAAALGDRVHDAARRRALARARWRTPWREAEEAMGGLDRVVNSAGIFRFSPFLDITEDDWRRMLDINLTGTFHGVPGGHPAAGRRGRRPDRQRRVGRGRARGRRTPPTTSRPSGAWSG